MRKGDEDIGQGKSYVDNHFYIECFFDYIICGNLGFYKK